MINFSIIIGVRNKEKFVQKAIKSCVQQKFNRSKYEVIIINCHYQCENCGFAENCHDMPHMIDMDNKIDE